MTLENEPTKKTEPVVIETDTKTPESEEKILSDSGNLNKVDSAKLVSQAVTETKTQVKEADQSSPVSLATENYFKLSELNSEYNQKVVKGTAFWAKLLAILLYVGAGFFTLIGLSALVTLILAPFSLFYLAGAGLYIFFGIKLWEMSTKTKQLTEVNKESDFIQKSMEIQGVFRTILKTLGISTIIYIGLLAIAVMVLIFFSTAALSGYKNYDNNRVIDTPYYEKNY